MREIDTNALDFVSQSLGVGNPATATEQVIFDDGNLQQVLDVSKLIRRGRSWRPNRDGGSFALNFKNEHPGAGDQTTTLDPYADGTTLNTYRFGNFPGILQDVQEVWLIDASVYIYGGTAGNLDSCSIDIGAAGWAGLSSQGGVASAPTGRVPLAVWNSPTIAQSFALGPDGRARQRIGFRYMPRQTDIVFRSTASGAVDVQCTIHVGAFPLGLGQDIAV